jgi:hypothetical protein
MAFSLVQTIFISVGQRRQEVPAAPSENASAVGIQRETALKKAVKIK